MNTMEKENKKHEYHYDTFGNIVGYDFPEYNIITRNDDLSVVKAKRAAQLKAIENAEKQ